MSLVQKLKFMVERIQNIVGKEENAGYRVVKSLDCVLDGRWNLASY